MPKKYILVKQHIRHYESGVVVLIVPYFRINPNYKETKMQNEDKGPERPERQVEVIDHGPAKKESRPTNVNVNIRFIDKHYQVTFRHEVTRIFHNMEEVLVAIEVEVNRLRG